MMVQALLCDRCGKEIKRVWLGKLGAVCILKSTFFMGNRDMRYDICNPCVSGLVDYLTGQVSTKVV